MSLQLKKVTLSILIYIITSLVSGDQPMITPPPTSTLAAYDTTCGNLAPTLYFKNELVQGGATTPVAWQSGLPVPSFDPQNRKRINLAGTWKKMRVDVDPCLSLTPRNPSGLSLLEAESGGKQLPTYDDSSWATKELPMVENEMPKIPGDIHGPEKYEAGVWYRRQFFVPDDWKEKLITLNFLGANYIVDVWVNGIWVGYHEGGYTPFLLDVSKVIQPGMENTIAIRVDNPAWGSRLDIVPAIKSDWWNYTGVIQDIYLDLIPSLWVVRADVSTLGLSGEIKIRTVLYNSRDVPVTGNLQLQARNTDPTLQAWLTNPIAESIASEVASNVYTSQIQFEPGQLIVVEVSLIINKPDFWSPDNPYLYVLEAILETDQEKDVTAYQFGLRTIETQNSQLLLNQKPFFMAGIARHEEWPESGRTASWEKILSDLSLIRSLGANFIRTAHYPNHIYTYILTDRLGLSAEVEIPLWQYTAVEFAAQEKRKIADQMWREMILSGSNRPSIFLWSTNNEATYSSARSEFINRVVSDFRTNYDDGRLVTQSAAADRGGPSDKSQAFVDIPGWTMYFGIFHGSTYYQGTVDFLEKAHLAYPDCPLLNTEFGIWSSGGGSNPEKQEEVFWETYRAFTEVTLLDSEGNINPEGYLSGVVWWTAFDWYTSHTFLQTMGLFSMDRIHAKPVADALQNAYQNLTASHSR